MPTVRRWCPYHEQGKGGHKAFLGELPRAAVLLLINLQVVAEVEVQDSRIDEAESAEGRQQPHHELSSRETPCTSIFQGSSWHHATLVNWAGFGLGGGHVRAFCEQMQWAGAQGRSTVTFQDMTVNSVKSEKQLNVESNNARGPVLWLMGYVCHL